MRLSLILLLSLCLYPFQLFPQNKPATPGKIIDIDINKALKTSKEFKLSQIVKDVDFIFLEDNVKCSMSGMTEFTLGKNYIMAGFGSMGPNTTHLVHIFDRSGKYLRSLGSEGKGPGEYLNLFKAAMDPLERFVLIVDLQQNKLIKYDLSGKFLVERKYSDEIPVSVMPIIIRFDDSGNIYLYCQRPNLPVGGYSSIFRYDQNLKPLTTIFPRKNDEDVSLTIHHRSLTRDTDHFVFWETFFDTVYYVYPDKPAVPKFHLSISSGGWPKDMLRDYLIYRKNEENYITTTSVLDLPGFLLIGIRNKNWYSIVYNKMTGESFSMTNPQECWKPKEIYREGSIKNDIIGFENLGLGEYLPDQKLIAGQTNPNYLLNNQDPACLKAKKVLLPAKRDQLIKYIQECKGDEGPVIVLWHLK